MQTRMFQQCFGYRSLDDVHYDVKQAYLAGVEFGYNKCNEELNQKGLALQSDMDETIKQNITLKKKLEKSMNGIKVENTSCYISSKGFTGIEINGVRFSNIGEMLRYMNKQRTQLIKAKELIKEMLSILPKENIEGVYEITEGAEQFLSEVEK